MFITSRKIDRRDYSPGSKNRQGITLLFVVSIIVLFLLMGTTFVVVSNDYLRGARRRGLADTNQTPAVTREAGSSLVERAMDEIIRGPSLDFTSSPLRTHDLLGDQYGYGHSARIAIERTVAPITTAPFLHASQQFIQFQVMLSRPSGTDGTTMALPNVPAYSLLTGLAVPGLVTHDGTTFERLRPPATTPPPALQADTVTTPPGHFNGRLITVTTGGYRGLTIRVISSRVAVAAGAEVGNEIHTFVAQPISSGYDLSSVVSLAGADIVVNGRPFAGTGVGRFDESQKINENALNNLATRPNQLFQSRERISGQRRDPNDGLRVTPLAVDGYLARNDINPTTGSLKTDPEPTITGSQLLPNDRALNEPWDAPDEQNMFLAKIRDIDGNDDVGGTGEFEPSFFRESLTTGWEAIRAAVGGDASFTTDEDKWNELVRRIRNTRQDFRAFSHMFAGYDPLVNGYPNSSVFADSLGLDRVTVVDNDNDGTEDGIWMDAGYPVQSTPEGGYVKPLVSYLVLDMDGRINLNTDGNLVEYDDATVTPSNKTLIFGHTATDKMPEGLGWGPAEVSMSTVLTGSHPAGLPFNGKSVAEVVVTARYGNDGLPGRLNNTRDGKSRYALAGYPDVGSVGNHFGSELDINGRYATGFIANGANPLLAGMPSMAPDGTAAIRQSMVDSPYEIAPGSASSNGDELYSPSELEHVLRGNDRDTFLLDKRLEDLLGPDLEVNPFLRKLLTTTSFEVPAIPADINQRLYAALLEGGMTDRDEISVVMGQLLSPEIRRGTPMNINRIFGDGIDNSMPADGVIDDSAESETTVAGLNGTAVSLDTDNNGIADSAPGEAFTGVSARINFARRLYILMILLTEREDRDRDGDLTDLQDFFDFDGDEDVNTDDIRAHRKMLAQWCVNVVDFRDADSIMTPFEFDLQPFTDDGGSFSTWDVDGEPLTTPASVAPRVPDPASANNYFIVWGTERPEVLISETLAMHDVRTEDRADDNGSGESTDDSDPDFDSALMPNASAFIELYNPWRVRANIRQRTAPRELYNAAGEGVNLFALSSDGAPIWRMIVVNTQQDPADNNTDVRDKQDIEDLLDTADAEITRYIYLTEPTKTGGQFDGNRVYHPPTTAGGSGILLPGSYAVAGSAGAGGAASGTNHTTYFGRRTGDTGVAPAELNMTQRIVLRSGADEVAFYGDGTTENIRNALAIPLAHTTTTNRPLGFSDPVGWYSAIGGTQLDAIDDGFKFIESVAPNDDVILDSPADKRIAVAAGGSVWENSPVRGEGLLPDFRVVYLQRLANPLRPHNDLTNPYRVVDSHSVDLYVFNGLDQKTDPDHTTPTDNTAKYFGKDQLDTFERAESLAVGPANPVRSLWRTAVTRDTDFDGDLLNEPPIATPVDLTTHVLPYGLTNSLGRINSFYLANGSATDTFPWLTWNNRPYVSQYELANVPYTSAHWLTRSFNIVSGTGAANVYQPPANKDLAPAMTPPQPAGAIYQSVNFSHLLNFYADRFDTAGNDEASDILHYAFDYLEVPSRFAGTNQYVNTTVAGMRNNAAQNTFGYRFSAPFDELPTYRNPGKINVNTIPSQKIWNALLGDRDTPMAAPERQPDSTRAYSAAVPFMDWVGYLDNNPVRPAAAANLTSETTLPIAGSADAGLFRRTTKADNDPLLDFTSTSAYNNTDRNPYFRNGIRTRLGNLATNRSSVFAVWVTIGYFECDPAGNLTDANSAGLEYGFDEGNVKRNRGFFVFDRSIPMAYEPGQNHNIEDGVLLKSIIE